MKTKLALALTVVGLVIGLASTGTAQNSDDGDVTVNVSDIVKIDVSPDSLSYGSGSNTAIEPGTYETQSDGGYTGIEIENSGSVNLSNVWVETSEPTARPFGTGGASNYDAGNMIQLRGIAESGSTGSGGNFLYAGRREYNESNTLSYVQVDAPSDTRYGRFRSGDKQFFWAINGTGDTNNQNGNKCSGNDDSSFLMGRTSHGKNTLGSVDFRDTSQYVSRDIGTGASDGTGLVNEVDVEFSGGNVTYDVYTWCGDDTTSQDNSTYVAFHKWDRQSQTTPGTDLTFSNPDYLFAGSASDDTGLQPGEHFTVETRVSVPFGVAEGTVSQGNMTIYASE